MAFTSLPYAVFLAAAVAVYYRLPARWRWAGLLVGSYAFYFSWGMGWVLFAVTGVSYLAGLGLGRARGAARKPLLAAGVLGCLAPLLFYKYWNFAAENIAALLRLGGWAGEAPVFSLALPVGISFFTFQAVGYLVDVYRGKLAAVRHPGHFALFLGFFPPLVSGPIQRADALLPQLTAPHPLRLENWTAGLQRICIGLFQKLAVADTLGVWVDNVYDNLSNQGGWTLLLATLLFTIQIYGDFAGYSNIAIGSARLFGIELSENFQSPYTARSVKEFWRRWHISLSRWFSEYVYIPLGGSRCSRPRHLANLLLTFLCSGLWHGASWTFVLWGLYHGLWLCLETVTLPKAEALQTKLAARNPLAGRLFATGRTGLTFCIVSAGWAVFRANSPADLGYLLTNWARGLNPLRLGAYAAAAGMDGAALAAAALLSAVLLGWDWYAARRQDPFAALARAPRIARLAVYYGLSLAALAAACTRPFGATADFIYFQF